MLGFGMVKSAGKNIFFQLFRSERDHLFGRVGNLEKFGGDFIHPLVRTLSRKNYRHEQFVRRIEF